MTHAHGTFCFAELVSSDADSARRFYGDLFGWTAEDVPGADGSAVQTNLHRSRSPTSGDPRDYATIAVDCFS